MTKRNEDPMQVRVRVTATVSFRHRQRLLKEAARQGLTLSELIFNTICATYPEEA